MEVRRFSTSKLVEELLAGSLWFGGLGIIGAVAAAGDPANMSAGLGVMLFGAIGASVLLATLKTVKRGGAEEVIAPAPASIKINRRGASKAA